MRNVHLNKISISNARRFAKDVEIDFGKGATILLAPNGTGKTTIFEAVELALTGSLESKLGNPPNALIRDGKSELDIRLDFDDNLYCEVAFRHGQNPVLKGDHMRLFQDKIDSAPYLLGLTHFLDQRGKGWFVNSEKNEAGDSLDKLSIGQGLNKVLSKRTSITRVVNQEITSLENQYDKEVERKNRFIELKMERDRASSDYKLVPLESIFKIILQGHRLVKKESPEIQLSSQALSLFLEKTRVLLISEKDSNTKLKIKHSSIESKLKVYKENTLSIKGIENDIESNEIKTNKLKEEIKELKSNVKSNEESKANMVKDQDRYKLIRKDLRVLDEKRNEYQKVIVDIQDLKLQFSVKQDDLTVSSKELDTFLKLKREHEILDEEINQVLKKKEDANELYPLQAQWELLVKQISDIEEKNLPNYEKKKSEFTKERNNVESDQVKNKLQIDQTNEIIEKYQEGSNAIQSSVNNISRYLSDDQGKCPVCNTNFKPEDLQKQIKIALELMNPIAHKMTHAIKELEDEQKELNDRLTKVKSSIEEIDGKITHEKATIDDAKSKLSVIIKSFPNCSNTSIALQFILSLLDKHAKTHSLLQEKKVALKDMPSDITITETRIKNEKNLIEVEKYKRELQAKESIIKVLSEEVAKLEIKTKGRQLDQLSIEISELELKIESSTKLCLDNSKSQEKLQKELEALQTERHKINTLILELKSHQNQIETEWKESELQDKPSLESLLIATKKTEKFQGECNASIKDITEAEQQLVHWSKAELFTNLNKKIQLECGDRTEVEQLKYLISKTETLEKKILKINELQGTMNFFLQNVSSELQQMNKYVESINEPWGELLQRTIVNSRFSTGELLKSKTFRNRPIAEIATSLNGNNIPVSQIASEAQLTDLQLTFMLAMAKQHHWTPWRALLLDDPTQHHDLVHASSVFDLLRDYISDLDFQVMLSTHDSQQANFFRRKLENDGIENKIYRLKAGNDGVFADLV
ncbi:MAG: hypothetical protein COC06_05590 [Bacteroidales bacterium]|nr:MAG: hypothetical protein COC06_05590 [Bacteroidales bacterium]